MANYSSLLAQAGQLGIDPAMRGDMARLLRESAGQAAAAPAPDYSSIGRTLFGPSPGEPLPQDSSTTSSNPAFPLNPVFQPVDDQKLGLTGTTPVGGSRAAGIGSALLGGQPNSEPAAAAQPTVKALGDTYGGKMALGLMEKKKKLSWATPDFVANRIDRDIDQALDLARVEMGGSESQDASAQRSADRLAAKEREKAAQDRLWAEQKEAEDNRKRKEKELADRLGLDRDRFLQSTKEATDANADRDADRAYREKVHTSSQAAKILEARTPLSSPSYDVGASDPASTGVFAKFAQRLLQDDPMMPPEDVRAAQVNASRSGALPPMMSTPADRPRTTVDPKTGSRSYEYPNGRVEPEPAAAAPSGGNATYRRDPKTGKLVRVR